MNKKYLVILFAFFLLTLISRVHGATGIDLSDFPRQLSDQLGIDLFSGELLTSAIIFALFVLPTIFITILVRTKSIIMPIIMGILSLAFCIAMGWIPVWVFAIICLIIALATGFKFKELV